MFYVYVLKSLKDGKFYTGSTNNLKRRFQEHCLGEEKSTRYRRPFELIYYESCLNRRDSLRREIYLKTSWGKRYIKNRLKYFMLSSKKENSLVSGESPREIAQSASHGTPFDAKGYQTGGDIL